MIECVTYRLSLHTTADDPTQYRDEQEVEEWKQREPIRRFQQYLIDKELLSDDDIETLHQEIDEQIDQAIDRYEEQKKELAKRPEVMFEHLYTEPAPYLEEQRAHFMQSRKGEESADA